MGRKQALKSYFWNIVVNLHDDPWGGPYIGICDCRPDRDIIIHICEIKDKSKVTPAEIYDGEIAYSVEIKARSLKVATEEMQGQLSDGLFENCDVTSYARCQKTPFED